jgi:hypothetical protein
MIADKSKTWRKLKIKEGSKKWERQRKCLTKKKKNKRINEKETNEERLPHCRSRAMWDMYVTGRGEGGVYCQLEAVFCFSSYFCDSDYWNC